MSSIASFAGTDRFVIRTRLGAGAMGIVYRALDRERGVEVALKVLRDPNPAGIYRFKQEFRALTDVLHENLVPLYELVSTGALWFFTMQLVDGVDFLRYVRFGDSARERAGQAPPAAAEDDRETPEALTAATNATLTRRLPRARRPGAAAQPLSHQDQFARLRAGLRQLARGVRALHDAGKLHRDIKPSNVLVDASGRVVLLDFGVVTALADEGDSDATAHIIGTPSYMAPEQAAGERLSPASDWYAVGVMMFEALTGRRPFRGEAHEVMASKRSSRAPAPSSFADDLPEDLERLCVELLSREPADRPSAAALLQRLEASPEPRAELVSPAEDDLFVGRERERRALRDAFAEVCGGAPMVALVHGNSGMGKSALVDAFLRELDEHSDAMLLRGRCYERESVPYKAMDSLVDALAQHLLSLSHEDAAALMPEHVNALARIFPVLRQVGAVIDGSILAGEVTDPHELRRRAFAAFRELLARLSERGPVVLAIDDLQWGDRDSAALLAHVLRRPGAPAVLLVGSYRRNDAETSELLQHLLPELSNVVDIAVDRLAPEPAIDLAAALLGGGEAAREAAEAIALDAEGSPFFITALAHRARTAPARGPLDGAITVDGVLRAQFAALPPAAQRLLEVVAVAGHPIAQATAKRAARLDDSAATALAQLRAARLISTRGARERDAIETAHDRVRETVVAELTATELADCHRRLAFALEGAERADPEALAAHFEGAGEARRAARWYVASAEIASAALAFDRAAARYHRALELDPLDGRAGSSLWAKLGEALANAGRGRDAALAYRRAVPGALASDALEYRRHASEQLLLSGHLDEGVAELNAVLAEVGLSAPETNGGTLASLVFRRAALRLRGLRFQARDSSQLSPEALARVDVCWSATIGYSMMHPIRGAEFEARQLQLALRVGEQMRVARAIAAEATLTCVAGGRALDRAERLLEQALELAAANGDTVGEGWTRVGKALATYMRNRGRPTLEYCDQTELFLREHGKGLRFALANLQLYRLWSCFWAGEIRRLRIDVREQLRDARERGDLYSVTNLSTGLPSFSWLARGEPTEARQAAEQAMKAWSPEGVHLQHYWQMLSYAQADIYVGAPLRSLEFVRKRSTALKKAFLFRIEPLRVDLFELRARCNVASARASQAERKRCLAEAKRDVKHMRAERLAWLVPLADLLRGGIASVRGDLEGAARWLERGAAGCDAHGFPMHAAAARRQLGALLGGDRGAMLVANADQSLRARGIVDPACVARVLVPGVVE